MFHCELNSGCEDLNLGVFAHLPVDGMFSGI